MNTSAPATPAPAGIHQAITEAGQDPAFESAIRNALHHSEQGRPDLAQEHLQEAMRLSPSSALPHFLLAANWAESGDALAAEAEFVLCLSRAPDFLIARFQLGLLQLTNGRAAVAAATWEPLLALDDGNCLKHFVRGFLEILRGDQDAAERAIHAGLALNTDNPQLNRDMEGVLSRLASLAAPAGDPATADHFLVGAYRSGN